MENLEKLLQSQEFRQAQSQTCLWWFDEVSSTNESEDEVRSHMIDDQYIEGLEWGIVRRSDNSERGFK
jgi:hypothetical protein